VADIDNFATSKPQGPDEIDGPDDDEKS